MLGGLAVELDRGGIVRRARHQSVECIVTQHAQTVDVALRRGHAPVAMGQQVATADARGRGGLQRARARIRARADGRGVGAVDERSNQSLVEHPGRIGLRDLESFLGRAGVLQPRDLVPSLQEIPVRLVEHRRPVAALRHALVQLHSDRARFDGAQPVEVHHAEVV